MTRKNIIDFYGGVNIAAQKLGFTRYAIWKWKKGIPIRTQEYIEKMTEGNLKAEQNRGDND